MWKSTRPVAAAVAAGVLLLLSVWSLKGPPMEPFFTDKGLVPGSHTRKYGNGHSNYDPVSKPTVRKTTCNTSHPKTDICEMEGDIRIHGKTGVVHSISSPSASITNQWRVKPYPRKGDPPGMEKVRELTITELQSSPLRCEVNHTVPAIVFSTGTWVVNFFHALADVLAPLFVTSYPYCGKVQFLITDFKPWFISRYKSILDNFTRYDLIDLDSDDRVHCFPRATIGLKHDETLELPIDPSTGLSLRNFTRIIRSAYSLPRSHLVNAAGQRPLLLLLSRKWTRRFVNMEDIVRLAESVGFEVMVTDGFGGGRFASLVNMCDVMLGVHGQGLTNMVFLPEGAVLVQVVPLGGVLQWMRECYGSPALQMGLQYLEYEIEVGESTLADLYPINHTVLVDPGQIMRSKEYDYRDLYMVKQNVRINVTRFRGFLSDVFDVLRKPTMGSSRD